MSSEQRYAVVRRLLESNGWRLDRINGSHHIFKRPGHESIILPVHHNKVMPAYVRDVEKKIRQAKAADSQAKGPPVEGD